MAQQQIITKPYVEELQDNDSMFINHDGALRQIKKSDADFASGADMRAEVAARKAFEAQEVAAREAFEKSETEARGQFETSVGEQISEKANIDGYYEEMTVGDAEQLIATQFVEDNEPYLFRPTGGSSDVGNRAYFDKIVGGTVAWNQLVKQSESPLVANGVTSTHNTDGTVTLSGTITSYYAETHKPIKLVANHVYLFSSIILANPNNVSFTINPLNLSNTRPVMKNTLSLSSTNYGIARVKSGTDLTGIKFKSNFFDLTQMFGSAIADYVYSIEQSQAGAGVAWFKKLFPKDYYEYNAGELLSVEGLESHDTVGFNQWDEEWEVGYLGYTSSNEGQPIPAQKNTIRSKNFIEVFPNTSYYFKYPIAEDHYVWEYDENKSVLRHYQLLASGSNNPFTTPSDCHYIKFACEPAYGSTYNHDICINLSNPSRNGEYEPYEKHSYPLDSSLTLRGIPKLDASNNLYYDGDEYTSDGKVKRKYGVVVLNGSEPWYSYQTNGINQYYLYFPTHYVDGEILCACDKFTPIAISERPNNYGTCYIGNKAICFNLDPTTFPTIASFQTYLASNNVTVVYPLATPTTETAEPFHNIQVVDDFGTEEFVSTGIVPVGHKTRYPANLRDKLQHLPDLAGVDGTYLIRQTGKQMSLVHTPAVFPETPTEDGTYTLKTVVTGGVATLQWVVE